MPKKKCGFAVAMAIAFAIVLSGCSDNKARQAGKELRSQINDAQRLCNTAMTLMRNVVFIDKDTRETPPLSKEVTKADQISFPRQAKAINLKALAALDKAVAILETAIQQYAGDAGKTDVGLAYQQQARTHALRAHYHRAAASLVSVTVQQFILETEQAAHGLSTQAVAVGYYKLLAGGKNEQAEEILLEQTKAADLTAGELAKLDNKIKDLQTDKLAQTELMDKRIVEARELQVQSRQPAKDSAGMVLLEKALAKQAEAHKAAARIAGIENEIDVQKTQRGTIALKLALAKAIRLAMEGILEVSRKSAAESLTEQTKAQTALAEDAIKAEARIRLLAGECQELGRYEKLAEECLSQASDAWTKAQPFLGDGADSVESQKGDTHMAWAQLSISRLRFRTRIDLFGNAMKSIWQKLGRTQGVPTSLHGLGQGYLADATGAKKQAETQYEQAVTAYAKALDSDVGPKLRWSYQGQLATAYIGLYQLTGDPEKRDEARDLLDKALDGRESSQYLASLVWFHRQLQQ